MEISTWQNPVSSDTVYGSYQQWIPGFTVPWYWGTGGHFQTFLTHKPFFPIYLISLLFSAQHSQFYWQIICGDLTVTQSVNQVKKQAWWVRENFQEIFNYSGISDNSRILLIEVWQKEELFVLSEQLGELTQVKELYLQPASVLRSVHCSEQETGAALASTSAGEKCSLSSCLNWHQSSLSEELRFQTPLFCLVVLISRNIYERIQKWTWREGTVLSEQNSQGVYGGHPPSLYLAY